MKDFTMQIYSRTGQLIFQTNSLSHYWDGNYSNGEPAPPGVYVYKATIIKTYGAGVVEQGTITLIR